MAHARQTRQRMVFEQVGIASVLMRHRMVVPLYQREYFWEEKEVLALFHDLGAAIEAGQPSYFLGTIVVTPNEDGTLEVVDGQQRLATVTILLAAIRDYFQKDQPDELLVQSLEEFLLKIVRETREIAAR